MAETVRQARDKRKAEESTRIVLSGRDERIMTTLYGLTVASTEHLAEAHFPSVESARKRMGKLKRAGYVDHFLFRPREDAPAIGLWVLKPRLYRREAKNAGRAAETYPKMPKRMNHHLRTNDIYAAIYKPLVEAFDDGLIEGSNWLWKNEAHSWCGYDFSGRSRVHQLDAEVHFPDGKVFFIERQTRDAREPESAFYEKVERYSKYTQYMGFEKGQATLVFACDEKRDQNYAGNACREYGVRALVSNPTDAATFIIEKAGEVK